MLIITSPAKTLDMMSSHPDVATTQPLFLDHTEQIAQVLKKKSIHNLGKLMHISEKIAGENYVRFQRWNKEHGDINSRPAIFTYAGDIFVEMYPNNWNDKQGVYAQKSLRIISGLYGTIRPYDLIQPYRLEMKTKLKLGRKKNLYDFWKLLLTNQLNKEIEEQGHKYLLNLASDESSDAIDLKQLNCEVTSVEFREKEDGVFRNVPLYNKHARGMMIEYCVKHTIEQPEDIKRFTTKGYKFHSHTDNSFLFAR